MWDGGVVSTQNFMIIDKVIKISVCNICSYLSGCSILCGNALTESQHGIFSHCGITLVVFKRFYDVPYVGILTVIILGDSKYPYACGAFY